MSPEATEVRDAKPQSAGNSANLSPNFDQHVFATEKRMSSDVAQRVLHTIDGPNRMTIVDNHGRSVTGTPKSGDFRDGDGTRTHINFDRGGRPVNFDVTSPNGTVSHGVMDADSGNVKYVDSKSKDGTTEHDQFNEGKLKTSDFKYKDGSSDRWEYDADGYAKSVDKRYADGTVEHNEFNPDNGNARFTDVSTPNGLHDHYEFDKETGTVVSHDQNFPDGTTVHEGAKPDDFKLPKPATQAQ